MAILGIEEFQSLGKFSAPVAQYPPVAIQQITIGGSSAGAASAFSARTNYVRLVAGAACRFKIASTAPTAADDATSSYLPAGAIVDIGVQPGHFIAAITAA